VVVHAPPGAGKTTRIPLALLEASWLGNGRIVMLEPRRLAATNAARWMAGQLGEEVGRTVGYQIRFERRISAATRIEVVTEGILARRLQADPGLSGIAAVIFDEFHERSLQADLALALCRDVQTGLREELKLIVMSATLDGAQVASLLGDAPVVGCEGRQFPVEVRYLPREKNDDVSRAVAAAVAGALGETSGDILAFLPGSAEIRRCQTYLKELQGGERLLVAPLFGDLPFAEQERAIQPARERKVVLATNIAETSLTIEGVRVVVDGGWCRRLRFDAAKGLDRLVTERISAASAVQRAGRSGRLGPGICYRLWSEHQQQALIPFDPPEILIADLAPLALELALWGVADPAGLNWIDPPPTAAYAEARTLLVRLRALDSQGRITAEGKRMAELPLHPRLAHMLLMATVHGLGPVGCDLAAILSERDIFPRSGAVGARHAGPSDLLERVEALRVWRRGSVPDQAVDPAACRTADRTARQLRSMLRIAEHDESPVTAEATGLLLASAYPDRIARQREPGSDRYLLSNGRGASLSAGTVVRDRPFIVAVDVAGGEGGEGLIRLAHVTSLEQVRSQFAAALSDHRVIAWDAEGGRVVGREEERFDSLVLATRPFVPSAAEARQALVAGVIAGPGLSALSWSQQAVQLRERVGFLARTFPGDWPDVSEGWLLANLAEWLGPWLERCRSLADLARIDLVLPLKALLHWEQLKRLDEGAPTHVAVPSGSRIRLDYSHEGGPVLAVKLQELFGLAETPRVAWGRVPLLLHLLSPAGRPMQVTSDLRNFWNSVYPLVKKELKGRYPRHPWPDDPWLAEPTRHTKKRST
jgi:ATP-dependent RNA helicase HrpB